MSQAPQLYEKLVDQLTSRPVSETLTYLILFAHLIGDETLERWAKLESDGYLASNPALRDDDVLPEYRSVAGQYRDSWDRPLMIHDPKTASIVQNEILRDSVAELEDYSKMSGFVRMINPTKLKIMREFLGVEVVEFVFSPAAVSGVLNAVRNQVLERLRDKHADMNKMLEVLPQSKETKGIEGDIIMGDKYVAGQGGIQGPNAYAHDMTFNQVWNQAASEIDLEALVEELSILQSCMKAEASDPEHYISVGSVGLAEKAAKDGNKKQALEHLAKAGKWSLDVATKIGTEIAVAAIRSSIER